LTNDDIIAHVEKSYRQILKEAQLDADLLGTFLRSYFPELKVGTGKPRTVTTTSDLIAEILNTDTIKNTLITLTSSVLESYQFKKACNALLLNLWRDLMRDPETTAEVVKVLQNALEKKEMKVAIKSLVLQIITDEEVYDELMKLVLRLGQDRDIIQATQRLLTVSAHNALNDPEILDHSMEFATDVVGDDVVQRTSGEALRNTVTYAVRPGVSIFLSLSGICLLLFGLSALANSKATERESIIVDKALSTMSRNIQKSSMEILGFLISLPRRLVSACLSAMSTLVSYPLKYIHKGFSWFGTMVGNAGNILLRTIKFMVGLPVWVVRSSINTICTIIQGFSKGVSMVIRISITSLISWFQQIGKFTSALLLNAGRAMFSSIIRGGTKVWQGISYGSMILLRVCKDSVMIFLNGGKTRKIGFLYCVS
jgi:hypothetical protein